MCLWISGSFPPPPVSSGLQSTRTTTPRHHGDLENRIGEAQIHIGRTQEPRVVVSHQESCLGRMVSDMLTQGGLCQGGLCMVGLVVSTHEQKCESSGFQSRVLNHRK